MRQLAADAEDEEPSSPKKNGPTKKQQEQLDKYGMTPETSIEVLFDHLGGADDDDPMKQKFLDQAGGEKFKEFLGKLQEVKQKKQQQRKEQQDEDEDGSSK